jgi:hypothetical protein
MAACQAAWIACIASSIFCSRERSFGWGAASS